MPAFSYSKFYSNWYVFITVITTAKFNDFPPGNKYFFVNLGNSKIIKAVALLVRKIIL